MIVTWSPRAIAHLISLRAYIARDRPRSAGRIAAILLNATSRLADFPGLGRTGRIAGTRELAVPGTPYVIAYRVRGERLEILAVFHGRQKWPERL